LTTQVRPGTVPGMAKDHHYSDGKGKVSLALDFRADTDDMQQSAYWNRLPEVAAFLALLTELCGQDVEVFFDFGLITIKNVDLDVVAKRIEGA